MSSSASTPSGRPDSIAMVATLLKRSNEAGHIITEHPFSIPSQQATQDFSTARRNVFHPGPILRTSPTINVWVVCADPTERNPMPPMPQLSEVIDGALRNI